MRNSTREKFDVIFEIIGFSGILLAGIVASSLALAETSHYQAIKIASALVIAGLVGYRMSHFMQEERSKRRRQMFDDEMNGFIEEEHKREQQDQK